MPRNWMKVSCLVALLVLAVPTRPARAVDPTETLLPAAAKGFISVTNLDQLSERWNKTQLGQLTQDPVMKPFVDDFRRQLTQRLWNLRSRLGLMLDDLTGVPGGELSVSLIQLPEDRAAVVLLIDVTGRPKEAQALLQKVSQNLEADGAKRFPTKVLGTPAVLFNFPKPARDEAGGQPQQTVYLIKDNLLVGADSLDVIQGILQRLAGSRDATLAGVPAFRAVMARCRKDAGEQAPQIRWFIEPFGYGAVTRAATPEKNRPRGKTLLQQLEVSGFDAVQGMGGYVDVAAEGCDLLHRTAVYAPKPYEKSMKMLVFPNAGHSQPPSWVPREIATFAIFDCDLLNAFDNIGPLFDQVAGEGEEGVWPDVLESLKTQEDGPHIDLREELFRYLDSEIHVITDYKLPITTSSERLLFAVAVKDADAVAKALKKTQSINEDVRRHEFQGLVIWETVPPEKATVQKVELRVPPLGAAPKEEQEEVGEPLLPNAAVTVAHGCLLIASHYDFLIRMLQPIDERETLGRSIDYLIVDAAAKRLAPDAHFLRQFSRTDEEYRATYELMRQGKMPQGESMLARTLNTLFAPNQTGAVRQQQIDGSKLPEFDYVRRHLGPAGTVATSEADGWFLKGFTLPKEAR